MLSELRAEAGDEAPTPAPARRPRRSARRPGARCRRNSSPGSAGRASTSARTGSCRRAFATSRCAPSILVELDAGGAVVGEPRIVKRSGNPWYDDGVVRSIQKASPLPPPPGGRRVELRVRRRRELLMRARALARAGSRCWCSRARPARAAQDRPAVVIDPGQARSYGVGRAALRGRLGVARAPGGSARFASRSCAGSSTRASSGSIDPKAFLGPETTVSLDDGAARGLHATGARSAPTRWSRGRCGRDATQLDGRVPRLGHDALHEAAAQELPAAGAGRRRAARASHRRRHRGGLHRRARRLRHRDRLRLDPRRQLRRST